MANQTEPFPGPAFVGPHRAVCTPLHPGGTAGRLEISRRAFYFQDCAIGYFTFQRPHGDCSTYSSAKKLRVTYQLCLYV